MGVFIAELRLRLNNFHEQSDFNEIRYELNEALNELEKRRQDEYLSRQKDAEIERLRQEVKRKRETIEGLINAGNKMRDELTGRNETATFKKWFKNLHPETIESITFNLRKKEN